MQLIVHLGLHKTGSSAIQQSLASGLRDPAWCYLAFGRPNGSLAVRQGFDETFARGPRRPRVRDRGRRTIADAFANATAERAVVSAESLSALAPADMAEAHAFFARHASDMQAIGYIRPTKSYFESAFQEILKKRLPGREAFAFDYARTLDTIDACFGRESVTLIKYARDNLLNGCVVQDFCARVGIAFGADDVRNVNESLSLEAVKLLYLYRLRHPAAAEGDERIVAALADLEGERFALHSELFRKLSRVSPAQTEAVARRIGEPFDEDVTAHDAVAVPSLEALQYPSPGALEWLGERSGAGALGRDADREAIVAAIAALGHPGQT